MRAVDTYNGSLRIYSKVKMVKLGGDKLEGATGQLVGTSNYVQGMICWIVKLDIPTFDETMGWWTLYVTMPSVCLELET
jgi:hypothetical protein